MPLRKLPYKSLSDLLKSCLCKEEDDKTAALISQLRVVRKRGWLTKKDLEIICRWKSARALHHIKDNHHSTIKAITKNAFSSRNEIRKINLLIQLNGVSIPMASSILMLTNPIRYGVIDIRVWEVLHKLGTVNTNPKGMNFSVNEWYRLLVILRYFSKRHKVSVRTIEYSIFLVHQQYQRGNLYQA